MRTLSIVLSVCACVVHGAILEDVFEWSNLEFNWPSADAKQKALETKDYVPENNFPLGIGLWQNKLFVTLPRWKHGVASSLGYVSLESSNKSPALTPYPSWQAHTLPGPDATIGNDTLVSVFRVFVDECDRLWTVDTGIEDILGAHRVVAPPSLVVYDLKTDQLLRRYTFKEDLYNPGSLFPNLVVDVGKDRCESAYAYIPDVRGYTLLVYSWKENDTWVFNHPYFSFDPVAIDLDVDGVQFQWTDGIFGMALSKPQPNGYKNMYFHAMISTKEFVVSTEVLQNKTLALNGHYMYDFKLLGEKGPRSQSTVNGYDKNTEVIFMPQLNKNGIACWNTNDALSPQSFNLLMQDDVKLQFPNDLKVYDNRVWVLSDRLPHFIYGHLNPKDVNYRVMKFKITDAIANTPCSGTKKNE